MKHNDSSEEQSRLNAHNKKEANWKKWGPYLSDRAWGTVREDYSRGGNPWDFFPHDDARSRVYRWNEDGLGGISDRNQYLCFALALWNGKDPILKERFFGLAGNEGNHGEDVKEYYFYLDNTPTHSYMKMLYKYPQNEFPYDDLVAENKRRDFHTCEYELLDTGVFNSDDYFDVFIEYAKAGEDDILIKISAVNRSQHSAPCHILPTLWFRNTWSWGYPEGPMDDVPEKPVMQKIDNQHDFSTVKASHRGTGDFYLYFDGSTELLFTENETNTERLYNTPNVTPFVKDAFHRYVIKGDSSAVNPKMTGTKAAGHYANIVSSGETMTLRLRLSHKELTEPFSDFETIFAARIAEADDFYQNLQPQDLENDVKLIQRQAFAGMLWSKQLYYFDIEHWLKEERGVKKYSRPVYGIRNTDWEHLVNFDIISMPDKWEYPWYASWDLSFHVIPLAVLDGDFAKRQIVLMTREWYMHPNGQLPAYEWDFSDVNPPVLVWAVWRVYKIDGAATGVFDTEFLKGIFHKLMLNFTWWVNRKDPDGHNVFQGGFLGLDNISLFDRSAPLPDGGHIEQSDGTAWMAFYSIIMMRIALELSKSDPIYQDTATKFFEHYLRIAYAMVDLGDKGVSLWDEQDGFFYDILHLPDKIIPLKVRSLVGLLPLFAVETLEDSDIENMDVFTRRMKWFIHKRTDYKGHMACMFTPGVGERHLMAILNREKLLRVLKYMLDENEFLSEYGIRSLSKYYKDHPVSIKLGGNEFSISYQPAEADSGLFGGNSNWRGPIWLPINYLIIESLQKFYHYYGDELKVEFPTHSGNLMTLAEVALELSKRLMKLFSKDENDKRPVFGGEEKFQKDPNWRNMILFYEYFHGDN
nr:glucosidase [Parachlamydiaceae bacterium]